jgi:hypothetical protein
MGIRDKWTYVETKAATKKRTQKELFDKRLLELFEASHDGQVMEIAGKKYKLVEIA